MLGNIFASKKKENNADENSHITERVSKMNLIDMRLYVRNGIKDFEISEFGIQEVTHKVSNYLHSDDMPTKKKKAFDLIILISKSKKVTINAVEEIQNFLEINKEIIEAYDKEFKEIYASRLNDAFTVALQSVDERTKLQNKMSVLGE